MPGAKVIKRQNKKTFVKIKDKVLVNGTSPSDHKLTHHFNDVTRHIENPLHKFASYNTLFTLSGLTEDEIRNPRQYLQINSIHDVIARSAGIGPAGTSKFTSQKKIMQLKDAKVGQHLDKIINDEKKSSELDHGTQLAGMVTQEFTLEKNFMEEAGWGKFLAGACKKWIELVLKKKISKFKILSSWIVRQFKDEYNPTHYHGGHISGVGYLKVPNNLGSTKQGNKKKILMAAYN